MNEIKQAKTNHEIRKILLTHSEEWNNPKKNVSTQLKTFYLSLLSGSNSELSILLTTLGFGSWLCVPPSFMI